MKVEGEKAGRGDRTMIMSSKGVFDTFLGNLHLGSCKSKQI